MHVIFAFALIQCKGEAAIDAFVEEFAVPYLSGNNMTHLSMLCCGCSRATVPVARISHYWNIPHVRANKQFKKISCRNQKDVGTVGCRCIYMATARQTKFHKKRNNGTG